MGLDGHREDEAGACGLLGVERDVATQATGDATGHGKADAIAVEVGVQLHEGLEDVLGLLGRNTSTSILDAELDVRAIGGGEQGH